MKALIRTVGIHALAMAVALVLLPLKDASAFEGLKKALARLADVGSTKGALYEFLAPQAIGDWPLRYNPGVSSPDIDRALASPGPAAGLTGIDFPGLSVILIFGEPPGDAIFLSGPEVSADAISAALSARGFERSTDRDVAVFAKGEDGRFDPASREAADPFGKSMGLAQRIAIGPLGILEARSRATVDAQLALVTDAAGLSPTDQTIATLYADMIAAASAAVTGMEAYAASGFDARAFGQPPLLPDSGGAAVSNPSPSLRPMPAFLYAFLVASRGSEGEAAQIVLAYSNKTDAEAGIAEVARRLAAFESDTDRTGGKIETTIVPRSARRVTIAIASVVFPASENHPSAQALLHWRNRTFQLAFPVLAPSR